MYPSKMKTKSAVGVAQKPRNPVSLSLLVFSLEDSSEFLKNELLTESVMILSYRGHSRLVCVSCIIYRNLFIIFY